MNDNTLKRIVSRFESGQRAKTQKAIDYVLGAIKSGKKADVAVSEAMKIVALDNKEVESALYEAAAYGYGIVPDVTADIAGLERDLSKAWNPDGMTLSQRLHGTNEQMREAVIDVIRTQLKKNEAMVTASRKLYEGYGNGGILTQKKAAEYIQKVRIATGGDLEAVRAVRKATNNIMRLSQNGAPTQALKAAYQKVVDMALTGTGEALAKAVAVAFEEKSRYVADRIIRTEASRAYADGFYAQTLKDNDVVAFRFKLSTRHPVHDICDLYAEADLFGMGAGVYPKNQCPEIPVHPNCLCYYSPIYRGEVGEPVKDIAQGGKEWLESISHEERQRVLGVAGAREFENGGNWQNILGDFELIEPRSRLSKSVQDMLAEKLVENSVGNFVESDIINIQKTDLPSAILESPKGKKSAQIVSDYINENVAAGNVTDSNVLYLFKNSGKTLTDLKDLQFVTTKTSHVNGTNTLVVPDVAKIGKNASHTWLHEMAHLQDNAVGKLMAGGNNTPATTKLASLVDKIASENVKLAVRGDYSFIPDKILKVIKDCDNEFFKQLRQIKDLKISYTFRRNGKYITHNGANALSDIYSALSNGYANTSKRGGPLTFGHSIPYFSNTKLPKKAKEIFADYVDLSITRPDLIKLLEEDQPELVKALRGLAKEMAQEVKKL